jgi:hypothetical protein
MMLHRALDSICGIPEDKHFLMSASIPVRRAPLPVIQKKIAEFAVELNAEFATSQAEELDQLTMQWFNLASATSDRDELALHDVCR